MLGGLRHIFQGKTGRSCVKAQTTVGLVNIRKRRITFQPALGPTETRGKSCRGASTEAFTVARLLAVIADCMEGTLGNLEGRTDRHVAIPKATSTHQP